MWHLPIPIKLIQNSSPIKNNDLLLIDSSIPYILQENNTFLSEYRNKFKKINIMDEVTYIDDIISSKHILLMDNLTPYDTIYIIINCLLCECIPILYNKNGCILDFMSLDIPKQLTIPIYNINKENIDRIIDDMVYGSLLSICKSFKKKFLEYEINRIINTMRYGCSIVYIDTGRCPHYYEKVKQHIKNDITVIKETDIIKGIQGVWSKVKKGHLLILNQSCVKLMYLISRCHFL